MQVTQYNPPKKEAFSRTQRKEKSFWKELAFFVRKPIGPGNNNGLKISPALVIRFYGAGSTIYCAFWLNLTPYHINATGQAGGYGYDKPSAAFADAATKAGFKFSEGISAVGISAVEDAGKAMLTCFGAQCVHIHTAHG